jgi:4-hydroxy-tetrahydrodipicolinate reductase
MNICKVMVNGLPGNVARTVAEYLIKDDRFELVPHSLTGPEIQESEYIIDGRISECGLHPPVSGQFQR